MVSLVILLQVVCQTEKAGTPWARRNPGALALRASENATAEPPPRC
jgi:hypothetical protein